MTGNPIYFKGLNKIPKPYAISKYERDKKSMEMITISNNNLYDNNKEYAKFPVVIKDTKKNTSIIHIIPTTCLYNLLNPILLAYTRKIKISETITVNKTDFHNMIERNKNIKM